MTIELWMLVAAVGIAWSQIMIAATPPLLKDTRWGFGNRETRLEVPAWGARADRASQNMKENLPLFAALVLVVNAAGAESALTALGAEIFVAARVVYAGIYIAGVPYLRTLVWLVSIVGMFLVASGLLG